MRKARAQAAEKTKAEPSKWAKLFAERNPDPPTKARWESMGNFLRPPMIQPFECRNVRIEGISSRIRRSGRSTRCTATT